MGVKVSTDIEPAVLEFGGGLPLMGAGSIDEHHGLADSVIIAYDGIVRDGGEPVTTGEIVMPDGAPVIVLRFSTEHAVQTMIDILESLKAPIRVRKSLEKGGGNG